MSDHHRIYIQTSERIWTDGQRDCKGYNLCISQAEGYTGFQRGSLTQGNHGTRPSGEQALQTLRTMHEHHHSPKSRARLAVSVLFPDQRNEQGIVTKRGEQVTAYAKGYTNPSACDTRRHDPQVELSQTYARSLTLKLLVDFFADPTGDEQPLRILSDWLQDKGIPALFATK